MGMCGLMGNINGLSASYNFIWMEYLNAGTDIVPAKQGLIFTYNRFFRRSYNWTIERI